VPPNLRIRGHLPAPVINGGGDSVWKWVKFSTFKCSWPWPWIGSYCIPHASVVDLYLHTKFHWNRRNFVDGRADGHLRPSLIGRLVGVYLKMGRIHWSDEAHLGGVVCHMARQWPIHVQNLTTSFSHSRDLIGTTKKLNRSRYFTTPLSGMICHLWAKICNLPTKFEASISTCFKDMKGDTNCRNSGGLRQLGVTQRRWKQDVALTGRITTGPPSRISYVTYAPPWSVTDDDRRQTASLVWPICVGGPVIIQ